MAKTKSGTQSAAMKHHSQQPNPFVGKLPKLTRSDDTTTTTTTKKKKKSKLGPKAVAMKAQPPKPNPFETIWSRRKFDILGKKRKGEERRVGRARSEAIEKRKKTLLKEYEKSGKSSVFLDKRIGEENDELDEFDKAIRRTQRERQVKQSKKSKYNLSDGEEEEFELQSLGALSQRDDFEDDVPPEDDDDGGEAKKKGYQLKSDDNDEDLSDGNENRHKSDKERYAEMILKSKNYKFEKSKEKDENKDLMEELDKKFTSVIASKALTNKSIKNDVSATQIFRTSEQEKSDAYDKLERELAMERRAQPSNRTKTPEEIAQEEREELERLEEERQKRMHPTDDYSDDDNEDADKPSTQRPRSISGDDLGDSFSLEEEPRAKKGWVDEILERKDASASESEGDDSDSSEGSEGSENGGVEGSDEDDCEGEKDLLNKEWEQSDDDNLEIDLDDEEEDSDEHGNDDDGYQKEVDQRDLKKLKRNDAVQASKSDGKSLDDKKLPTNKQSSTESDLPYIIEAPTSMEELNALLDDLCNADIALIIHRIRASNAIKLAAENKKKMQVFYGLLLQYFATLANKKPLNLELLNLLVKPLMEMSMETPYFASICARERILRTRTRFCETVKNPERSCWPTSKTLFLLRLWSLIFPCSDFRHVVMTPAIFLMCEYLTRCPILSGRDVAVGSFLCSLLLSITKQSQKFCPEAVTFLQTLLMAAKERKPKCNQASDIDHLMELKAPRPLLHIHESIDQIDPLNFLTIMDLPEDSSFFTSNNFRSSMLVTVIETLRGYVSCYEGFSSFPEIFLPISTLVLELSEQENMPSALTEKFKEVGLLIKTKADKHCMQRQPLQMRKQKPVAIKMLNPKFEENFVKGRDYDPDRERVERKKLKKRLTQEAKGAVRELRKDNYFLQEVKSRDKALMEEERAEKYGKARLFLQEQEHAMKSGQLGKGRGKRRR
ncbi:uncharacterized protein LOC126790198 [Argentina anserina]|uniref:uncharacterized protein LOC126790198 n=1 Tax=Argentina anserina TaxID=57926 RepID=UPI0021766616|nr:uncharacterized protein LOC126790198 [Potentilla anserina]